MTDISLEQNEQLKIWSSKRDAVVAELHINIEKNSGLILENTVLSEEKKRLESEVSEFKKILSQRDFVTAEIARLTPINEQLKRTNSDLNETILKGQESVNLNSWVGQRDSILSDIAGNRTENDKLILSNKNLAESNKEIEDKINKSLGRLEEIVRKEEEFTTLTKIGIAELSSEKASLQSEVSGLKSEILLLKENKRLVVENTDELVKINEKVFDRISDVDSSIEELVKVSSNNAREINTVLESVGVEFKKITDINALNVSKTNVVINDLPRIIFDLQRDIIERKKFHKKRI